MYKKTITFKTYGDEPETITDDFYFDINKAEAMQLELGTAGGYEHALNRMYIENDVPKMTQWFKDLVLMAYGERSADGRYFNKSKEIRDRFEHSDAFSELMWELFTKEGEAQKFFIGIMPKAVDANGKVIELTEDQIKAAAIERNPNLARALERNEKSDVVPTEIE